MHVSCLFFKPEAVSKHSVSLWIGYSEIRITIVANEEEELPRWQVSGQYSRLISSFKWNDFGKGFPSSYNILLTMSYLLRWKGYKLKSKSLLTDRQTDRDTGRRRRQTDEKSDCYRASA